MNAVLVSEINRLSAAEKLSLVEKLWDELAASEDQLPIPPWHEKALAEDQALYQQNPTAGSNWAEAKARITKKP